MATLRRIPVAWTGISALPGVSVFYAASATDAGANLATFFNAIKAQFPSPLQWTVPTSGDLINDADGALTGAWTGGTGGTTSATGSGIYPAGTGAYVNWQTAGIVNSRRLKGRTFLAPLLGAVFTTSGQISTTTQTALQTAATALATSGNIVIWHRPSAPGLSNGASSVVTGALVPLQVTSLRSRRV